MMQIRKVLPPPPAKEGDFRYNERRELQRFVNGVWVVVEKVAA